jgi:hypothetical protein
VSRRAGIALAVVAVAGGTALAVSGTRLRARLSALQRERDAFIAWAEDAGKTNGRLIYS